MSKILITLYVLCSSTALVLLKLGSKRGAPISFAHSRLHLNLTPLVLAGIVLYGSSFVLYMYLVSKFELGYIIPLTTAFIYICIFVASFLIFNEVFTATKIAGIVLIVAGLVLLNVNR